MGVFSVIGVAGFASAWMLLWGAAAAIPIFLHLLNRRRQQTVSWAAMRLLLQVIEKQSKRVRVEQLILLLLRTLILITLGLALARPFFTPQSDAGTVAAQRPPRLWILVIDNSYSMGYREEPGTRFAIAQAKASELIRAAVRGDGFSVITLAAPSEPVIFRPTFDFDSTVAAIQKIRLLDGGADLTSALAQINEIVAEAGRMVDLPSEIRVVFYSDFGQDTWQEALAAGRAHRPLTQLAAAHTVVYESLASYDPTNVAVTELVPATTRALKDRALAVDVTVTNFGSASVNQLPLQIAANGQTVESQFLDLRAGASRVVQLEVQPTLTGLMTVSASLPDDRLQVDNQRHAIVEIRDEFQVLCVENPYSDVKILKSALQPPNTALARMKVTSISQFELGSVDLSDFDTVVLNDVTSFSASEFGNLSQFVYRGGSLICLLGQNSDATNLNGLLGGTKNMLGYQLVEPTESADWRIDPLEYASPIVAPFEAYPDAGLLTTPVFRFWKVQLDTEAVEPPQIELKVQGDFPLIVLNRWGKGRTASLLSAPQTGALTGQREPWNAMAAWPSFVPLMQQLVLVVLADNATSYNLTVGQPLTGSQRAAGDTSMIRITRPDGTEADIQSSEIDGDGFRTWSFPATKQHGIFRVAAAGTAPCPFAVNLIPNQSDLHSVAVNQLPQSTENPKSALSIDRDDADRQPSNALVSWLLAALAAMLAAESCLAWHLGRRLG